MTENRRVAGVESGRRLLQVLFAFTESHPVWTVAELAESLDVPQSMVYRFLALLREQGLIDSAGGKSYRLTDRVLSLADALTAGRPPIGDIALPIMTELRDEFDETVLLSRRGGMYSYCMERVESQQPVRLQFERGAAMSLHRGSMARVLLAAMTPGERASYFSQVANEFPEGRPPQLQDPALSAVAEAGFTESYGEIDDGIWGVAAAVTVEGEVVASLGLAAPLFRTTPEKRQRITDAIVEAAHRVSSMLGSRAA